MTDKHPRELGEISEKELLKGEYSFKELDDLAKPEQQILLDHLSYLDLAPGKAALTRLGLKVARLTGSKPLKRLKKP
ncbi:hypothetical protein [Leptothoe spongobia]|uniref:Uncharacterized protein n=1 Tax=Leptothoe spongobia TAU-MAC 1115 TaxID=1967444 RepID=A0A947DIZ0_9CYAN|nr:hypothetical protein [Leptothoe spongobia]MBT9317568.1 hypothetical protein [Leptothoe spongobia TAU-MAC 1115]